MALPQFIALWADADSYPLNLDSLRTTSNNGALQAHRALLETNGPDLFNADSDVVILEFKEQAGNQASLASKVEIRDDAELHRYLVVPSPSSTPALSKVRCRIIFLQADQGEEPLNVTQGHACRLLTYFQVMPSYIDFMSVFTVRIDDRAEISDLRFSSFRDSVRLSPNAPGLNLPHLALTGRGYQLCYTLKSVANKTQEKHPTKWQAIPKENWTWSIRQGAFHHQFDVGHGTSLWILTSAYDKLQKRVEGLTGQKGRCQDRTFNSPADGFVSSLAVHLLLAQWASEDWRGYLRCLEQVLEEKTKNALRAISYEPNTFDLLFVQVKEDLANKALMMLEANHSILETLDKFYCDLMKNEEFELRTVDVCKRAAAEFSMQLKDYIHDAKMNADRARTLLKITADRKSLVQQHLQAKATDRVEKLTIQAQREANTMKVITVITMVYLPATFACTLFSTDVIKFQNPNGNNPSDGSSANISMYQSFSPIALARWGEVTGALTAVTFLAAYIWMYWPSTQYWIIPWRKRPNRDLEKGK